MIAGASLLALIFALRCFFVADAEVVWSWAFVPALVFLGLAALQLVPLPLGLLGAIAPGTVDVWRRALTNPEITGGMPSALPISL